MKDDLPLKIQVFRFLILGGSCALITIGLPHILVEWFKLHYLLALNITSPVVFGYSFLMNKIFVFKTGKKEPVKQGGKYIILQILLWCLANTLLFIGVDLMHIDYRVMMILAAGILAAINFTAMKFFVFR